MGNALGTVGPGGGTARRAEGVAAVVLCWNDADRVIALLQQLEALHVAPARVVVVDNGSEGDDLARIAAAFPRCETVALATNLGFAGGVNRGIERALDGGASHVWLLNPDIVLPPDVLAELLAVAARDARCGMVAPLLREPDGRLQAWGGGTVDLRTGVSAHASSSSDRLDYLLGACLLLDAAMLRDVGPLDEGYFFYWEDIDLGFRARAAGWTLAVADGCSVVHEEGSSLGRWSERRWLLMFRGMRRFLGAHAPAPRTATALRLLHHTAGMLRHGRVAAARGAWRAVLEPPPR